MIGDYTVLEKSMNGVKTLSDGISIISDGVATHENVYYTEFIKSEDEKTVIINDTITTETINVNDINALNIFSDDISTSVLNCDYLYVNDVNNPLQDVLEVDGNLKKLKMYGQSEFRDTINVINTNVSQTQGGTIQQSGTNFNTLKDTKINGFIEVGSNIVQTGGSTTLKDVTCDNITMNSNKGIAQSGTGTSNTLGSTTVTNLTITGSVVFPSEVEIPGTTTTDDIVMNGDSVVTQDITVSTTKFNKFRYTKTLDLDVDGDFTQTKANATAKLKNTIIQGTSTLQGDIEQTAGFTKLNTIECNNITLRLDNDLNLSGTGKISQTGTGINQMNAITLNNNQNITFNGSGIISQALNGINILSSFRTAGFGIVAGRNNTTFSHTQNIQNNNGLQFQYNRDNSTFYSYLMNNRVGSGGGFRFQRYNGGVYVDEPLVIDENITMNKDLNIVGKSISASSATLGIISQDELNCLDNCNLNIITKFNTLDNQIASLQTTTSGVSSNTTGITYDINNDTTTIDNNLAIPSGKTLTLGSTNVNSFITDTNTFINAATNTLQGIVYTSGNDTTTINNNVSITGNLLVQGMNIKAEIDALETSFTTGTLTSTNLTTGTLNVTNQINMTSPTRQFRNINNIGYANFCDIGAATDINSLSIGIGENNAYYNNIRNGGVHQFLGINSNGTNNSNRLIILPDAGNGSYNPTTQNNDITLISVGSAINTRNLNLISHSSTANGVRIEPTKTTMSGGNNNIVVDNSTGVNVNSVSNFYNTQNVNSDTKYNSGSNNSQILQSNKDLLLKNNVADGYVTILNDNNESIIVSKEQTRINNNVIISSYINNNQSFFTRQNITSNLFFTEKDGDDLNNNKSSNGSGSTYFTVFSTTVTPYFNKLININVPISVSRTFRNNLTFGLSGNNFTDTINSVTYIIFKNNQIWQSGNCIASESLPRQVYLSCNTKTSDMTYEFYMLNASLSFYPPQEEISYNYTVEFTINYSYTINATEFLWINYKYFFNTNVSTVSLSNIDVITDPITGQPAIGTYGTTFSNGAYSFTKDTINYFTGEGELWCNDIISNSIRTQGNITTSSISGINQPIHAWANIPCFYIDNAIANNFALQEFTKPIYCSYKALGSNDDAFIVYPGYILVVYRYAFYAILAGQRPWSGDTDTSSQTRVIDNSTGTSPIFIRSLDLYGFSNQVQSCRVYYKSGNNEMALPYYSYNV
jgi:hypothetical protein